MKIIILDSPSLVFSFFLLVFSLTTCILSLPHVLLNGLGILIPFLERNYSLLTPTYSVSIFPQFLASLFLANFYSTFVF